MLQKIPLWCAWMFFLTCVATACDCSTRSSLLSNKLVCSIFFHLRLSTCRWLMWFARVLLRQRSWFDPCVAGSLSLSLSLTLLEKDLLNKNRFLLALIWSVNLKNKAGLLMYGVKWKKKKTPRNYWPFAFKKRMGPVRIRHSSHDFGWLSSHFVDLAGWQAKMASIEIWIPWRNAHKPHCEQDLKLAIGRAGDEGNVSHLSWGPTETIDRQSKSECSLHSAALTRTSLGRKSKRNEGQGNKAFLGEYVRQLM